MPVTIPARPENGGHDRAKTGAILSGGIARAGAPADQRGFAVESVTGCVGNQVSDSTNVVPQILHEIPP